MPILSYGDRLFGIYPGVSYEDVSYTSAQFELRFLLSVSSFFGKAQPLNINIVNAGRICRLNTTPRRPFAADDARKFHRLSFLQHTAVCMWTSSHIGEKAVEVPLDVSPVVGGAQVFHGRNGRHGERGVLDSALQTLRELERRGHWSCHERNM